jgi:hypothetical protein
VTAALTALTVASSVLAGCGDACGELQVICDACRDPNHKSACERRVDDGPEDQCQDDIQSYGDICK